MQHPTPRPSRPWWGNPLVWLAIIAVFVVLGLTVFPALFGGVFLFLPLIWIRPRAAAPVARCPGCGRPVHPSHAFCPSCGARVPRAGED